MERVNANYNSCCRLCLTESLPALRSIFTDLGLSTRIRDLLAVDVNENDKLSILICDQCIKELVNWDRFREQCTVNQIKLLARFNSIIANVRADMICRIKDELIVSEPEKEILIDDDDTLPVKTEPEEPRDQEDLLDLPPPLTPNPPHYFTDEDEEDDMLVHSGRIRLDELVKIDDTSRRCKFCKKSFSTIGNRRKHERKMHQDKDSMDHTDVYSKASSSHSTSASPTPVVQQEIQKIQFAAGLKLQQKSQTVVQNTQTKLEVIYLDKCKSLCKMLETLECICHKEKFDDNKKILSHLRKSGAWYPVPDFTCYNCLITFGNQSSYTKHVLTCSKLPLQQLKNLTDLNAVPDSKCRLYQKFKCLKCCCTFTFHEDFCTHLDINHLEVQDTGIRPHKCLCGSEFNELNSYKDHSSITCFLRYYCDICFGMFKNLDLLKDHCVKTHDIEETIMSERRDEINGIDLSNQATKRTTRSSFNSLIKKPRLEANTSLPINLEKDNARKSYLVGKFIIPAPTPSDRRKKSMCLICKKELSSFDSMLRHLRAHDEVGQHTNRGEPKFSCPDCKHLFHSMEEWTAHKDTHEIISCKECDKTFVFQTELDQHQNEHFAITTRRDSKTQSNKNSIISNISSCRICNKKFDTKSELRQHIKLHEKMPILKAHDAEDIDNKTQKDLKGDKYVCVPCKLTFSYYTNYWEHNKNHHKVRVAPHVYPRKCDGCDRSFSTGGSYANHKKWHDRQEQKQSAKVVNPFKLKTQETSNYFKCKECFKVFASRNNLQAHMKSHENSARKLNNYWCNVCHQACPSESELEEHKKEHSGDTSSLNNSNAIGKQFFVCDICEKQFHSNVGLIQHTVRHNVKKTFVYCKYCKLSFECEDTLNRHMANEHDESIGKKQSKAEVKGELYKCDICHKDFNTTMALYSHRGWHKRINYTGVNENGEEPPIPSKAQPVAESCRHRVQTKFKCGKCVKQFTNATSLQIHILETHRNTSSNRNIMSLQCNSCKITFDSQTGFDKHMQLHEVVEKQAEKLTKSRSNSKKKSYDCTNCSLTFTKKDSLNAHIEQQHNNKLTKIFECQYCDRFFRKLVSLNLHMRIHKKLVNKKFK